MANPNGNTGWKGRVRRHHDCVVLVDEAFVSISNEALGNVGK